jgi:hypothetical protein
VYGESSSTDVSGIGVKGVSAGGIGVLGTAPGFIGAVKGTNGVGQSGVIAIQHIGVQGTSVDLFGVGVYGTASNSGGLNYGVIGATQSNQAGAYGLYSFGNTAATGTKSFRIDHPFDPANKYLLHYSAESPEPMNFYSGTVRSDTKGEAWVVLPDYFAEINKDFRYLLTVVDDSDSPDFVQAKVAKKISNNRFKIRTSAPNVEVCWRVDAVRNDRWVRAHGAPAEMEKQGKERGTYQNPELYGMPESMGWRRVTEPSTVKSSGR